MNVKIGNRRSDRVIFGDEELFEYFAEFLVDLVIGVILQGLQSIQESRNRAQNIKDCVVFSTQLRSQKQHFPETAESCLQ